MRFFALFLLLVSIPASSYVVYWQDVVEALASSTRTLTLDKSALELELSKSLEPSEFYTAPVITLPLPDGNDIRVRVTETQTLAPELANKFPDIKTFKLQGLDDQQGLIGRMDISQRGVYISVRTVTGKKLFIEPNTATRITTTTFDLNKDKPKYTSSWTENSSRSYKGTLSCQSPNHDDSYLLQTQNKTSLAYKTTNTPNSSEKDLIIYRIAISATQSYVDAKGGTRSSAMRAIASTINRINQVYERDAGIRLEIVANNQRLIAPDSAPFSGSLDNMIAQNQLLVDREIGSQHYDVGHLFTARGGGLAYVHSACRAGVKARAASGNLSVGSERYSLEFVAHEIGHQFGATHTFNSNEGLCTSSNRHSSTAYEPGSGSTIMSYIGICGADNIQNHADAMFHIGSVQQILQHKSIHYAKGCGVPVSAENNVPEVNAGSDYIIPVNTPFELSGTASDVDKDHLLFSWQQVDAGIASNVGVDKGNNALFRTYLPTTSKDRRFPRRNVGNRKGKIVGETLPQTNRLLHFKFVAQDSSGATVSDDMVITVVADGGAFSVQPIPTASFIRGESLTVQWEVADTDLPPISCAAVDITLSVDKGLNFDYSLVKAVPNSGNEEVTLPDIDFDQRDIRIKLSCSDNVFFAISPVISESNSLITDTLVADISVNNITNSSEQNTLLGGVGSSEPKGAGGSISIDKYWLLYLLSTILFTRSYQGKKGVCKCYE